MKQTKSFDREKTLSNIIRLCMQRHYDLNTKAVNEMNNKKLRELARDLNVDIEYKYLKG